MRKQSLLLNWVYYYPVGHAVEALKTAKGLANANPDVEIHLLLNARTPVELAAGCDWVERVYPIDVDAFAAGGDAHSAGLAGLPREWDYIVNDHRVTLSPFPFQDPLRQFHDAAAAWLRPRLWRGGLHEVGRADGGPAYERNATIRLQPPAEARRWAAALPGGGPKIAVLPGGSSEPGIYPSPTWWARALAALRTEWPAAEFYVTGKSGVDGRSTTSGFSRDSLEELRRAGAPVHDCLDAGLWNQVALLEACALLVAPHSGFAFLAPSVGTPWLAVSGARWPECYFNEVPFYCVLPECAEYPCWQGMRPECAARLAAGARVECMDEELPRRLPDLVDGARRLLSGAFPFEAAWALYQERIATRFAPQRFFRIE